MSIAMSSWPRALALKLALVAGVAVGALVLASPAQAQDPGTGARAEKSCPDATAALGETVTCAFEVENIGDFDARVQTLEEQSPFPGGTPDEITCTTADGAVIEEGAILAAGIPCEGTFQVTFPNDRTLCNTFVLDRVEIGLLYERQPPLFAGAFATDSTAILCPADIKITKTADALSKVSDPVTYSFEICNEGDVTVNRQSVSDTLLGDLSSFFPATLAPDQCVTVVRTRTVAAGDPDPLTNTVTAIYTAGSGSFASSDTATASASTNLFQPGVDVTKSCTPDPVDVDGDLTCTIVVTNTSSGDTPVLINGEIDDTLTGDLLDPTNPAVVSSTCAVSLPVGGTCTIVTERKVLATDPNPLVNTVTVNYNPKGFPNDISDTASDSVVVKPPKGGEGCTPGFWKQAQHFDSWVEFEPGDSFEDVFGVDDVTLRVGGRGTVEDPTLLEALDATGGGVNALARHAVAALLNASNPDVSSDFTVAEVIALVQDAFESGDFETAQELLAAANEQGCPLS